MAFHHRMLSVKKKFCICSKDCRDACDDNSDANFYFSPPPPPTEDDAYVRPIPPPPPPPPEHNQNHMPSILILMLCILGAAFLFFSYLTFVKRYRMNSRNPRDRNPRAPMEETREDFLDEDHGPVLDHPIWYIRTVGLQQSVIDSIAVFKYKKGEGLIEGTDCSVCLNEFVEDETLRLLPKCSHAFHIPCIDTWLRSHKNCPLCRAPIVSITNTPPVGSAEPDLNDTVLREETRVDGELGSHEGGESRNTELRVDIGESPMEEIKMLEFLRNSVSLCLNPRYREGRVLSDLGDLRIRVEEELQPVRRSVSMDASSAAVIYHDAANVHSDTDEGCSNSQVFQVKKGTSVMDDKQGTSNPSINGMMMKSSSFGRYLQKVPIRMKRSFTSTGNCSLPTYSENEDSIQRL